MANRSRTARLGTSAGSVSHNSVGSGKVPRAVAQGIEAQERAAFLEGIPPLSRGLVARSLAGTASPRAGDQDFLPILHKQRPGRDHLLSGLALSAARLSSPLALCAS